MNCFVLLSHSEFESIYSQRDYNPPDEKETFGEEFRNVLDQVEEYLERRLNPDEFHLHEYHNLARFIDVTFSVETYLDVDFVRDLQCLLSRLQERWMVCLWEACYLFVTRDRVMGYDPTGEDPGFRDLQTQLGQID